MDSIPCIQILSELQLSAYLSSKRRLFVVEDCGRSKCVGFSAPAGRAAGLLSARCRNLLSMAGLCQASSDSGADHEMAYW